MNQYVNKKFSTQYKATIGADFLTKEVRDRQVFVWRRRRKKGTGPLFSLIVEEKEEIGWVSETGQR